MPSYKNAAKRNPLAKGCEGCWFLSNYFGCCNYLIFTGKRRPCPGGKGCTVKSKTPPAEFYSGAKWNVALGKRMWEADATDAEIAAKVCASSEAVQGYRRKYWGKANKKPLGWDTELARQMRQQGKSWAEIGKAVGRTATNVKEYAKRHWGDENGEIQKETRCG